MELERGLLRFKLFLSTPSARRATSASAGRKCPGSDFYPRPPRGGRHSSGVPGAKQFLFLSTPSARRATSSVAAGIPENKISIHALREEGDRMGWKCQEMQGISIHALREEGDGAIFDDGLPTCKFLSTPSARRATSSGHWSRRVPWHFYPRPPRGGRRRNMLQAMVNEAFLSTPSARRATRVHRRHRQHHRDFYPRPPRGGRRQRAGLGVHLIAISIHALREEGDRDR